MPSTEIPEVMKRRGRVTVFAAAVAACVIDVATGGWGLGWSFDGTPVDQAQHEACWPRHHATHASAHDWIFTCSAQ
jgi:hypothetical protein